MELIGHEDGVANLNFPTDLSRTMVPSPIFAVATTKSPWHKTWQCNLLSKSC
jgi:hypothetical protein